MRHLPWTILLSMTSQPIFIIPFLTTTWNSPASTPNSNSDLILPHSNTHSPSSFSLQSYNGDTSYSPTAPFYPSPLSSPMIPSFTGSLPPSPPIPSNSTRLTAGTICSRRSLPHNLHTPLNTRKPSIQSSSKRPPSPPTEPNLSKHCYNNSSLHSLGTLPTLPTIAHHCGHDSPHSLRPALLNPCLTKSPQDLKTGDCSSVMPAKEAY